METLVTHKRGPMEFITPYDLDEEYQSKRVVISIETKSINYECLKMRLPTQPRGDVPQRPRVSVFAGPAKERECVCERECERLRKRERVYVCV